MVISISSGVGHEHNICAEFHHMQMTSFPAQPHGVAYLLARRQDPKGPSSLFVYPSALASSAAASSS